MITAERHRKTMAKSLYLAKNDFTLQNYGCQQDSSSQRPSFVAKSFLKPTALGFAVFLSLCKSLLLCVLTNDC
jgi:hypothetical protein